MNDRELLWRQYQMNIDLYRGYLELVVKINVFYYAITGAILSFFFSHADDPLIKWSLLLPLVMSVALGIFFVVGARLAQVPREETFKIRDALGLIAAPEIGVLILLLYVFATLTFMVSAGLLWVLWTK